MDFDASITLSPGGRWLACTAGDRIRVIDVSSSTEVGCVAGERAAVLDDALWVARGQELVCYDRALASQRTIVIGACGTLQRIAYGAPAVLWVGSEDPARVLVAEERSGEIVTTAIAAQPAPGDRMVPLTPHRLACVRRTTLAMLDATGRQHYSFDAGATVLHAAPVLEGRWIASFTGRRGASEQQLVLLDARDGRVQHRIALREITAARFTAMRGLAVLRAEERHLVVIDLRFGKVLRHHEDHRPILDLAVDDAGQRVILQYEAGELAVIAMADLLAGRVAHSSENGLGHAPPRAEEPTSEPTATTPPVTPEQAAAPLPLSIPTLHALQPRTPTTPASAVDHGGWLEAHRELVAALAARAIALGWDTGSIGFVDKDRPPFELEVAALVLGVRGLADVQLRRTMLAVETATARVAALDSTLGAAADPLHALAAEIGLDELERRLLLLIAAPALWGELARLYGILANDERRALCDEQLLVQLCGTSERHAIARALERGRPLVGHGLVHVGEDRARPFASLAVDPIVLRILRGEPLDAELDRGVELAPVAPPLEALIVPRAALQRTLDALAVPHPAVRLVLRGRAGSGRRTLASALAARAGRRVGVVDVAVHARERRLDRVPSLLRRTALRGWLPLVDGVDSVGDEQRDVVLDILRDHRGPLALRCSRDTKFRLHGAIELELPPLTIGQCADFWRARLCSAALAVADVDALAARFRVGPGVIDRCVSSIRDEQRSDDPVQDIEHAMRRQLASRLGEVATRVERLPTWSQVVLPDDIEDSVLELIARIRFARTVYDTWGFDQVMATSRGVTALFQGPPGTGKTLVAGAIANELGLDLYRIDVARVMSKWIGETEQNLAKVFAAAEESQAILLFDEADSLFAKRTEVKSSNDRYANTEVNYLLQRLDSFEGIAILTTNFGSSIDSAFKRRLSFRLTFPFPDDETREQLWKAHLPPRLPRADTIDLGALARRFRMSGGYIRNAALRAAFLAAEERSALTQDHLERAIRAEFREIGNLADTGMLA